MSYSGEINIIDGIKVPGFKAAGLSVQVRSHQNYINNY